MVTAFAILAMFKWEDGWQLVVLINTHTTDIWPPIFSPISKQEQNIEH